MFVVRRLHLSCKHGAANILRGKRIQSFNYSKSTKRSHGKTDVNPQLLIGAQTYPRSRLRYAAPALVLGFTGFIGFLHYNDERRAVPKGITSSISGCGCGSNTTVKGPIIGGPFTLMSTQKNIVSEKEFCGQWVLLYFGYSFSPDVGPEQLKMMSKAVHQLESNHDQKILPVFVTLDPLRDTPSHLHAYLKEFDSRILGLTGSASAIRQMAQEYRVYFKKVQEDGDDYLVGTCHNMYLLNPKMEVVRCFGTEYNPDDLSHEVLKEVTSVSQ
ncbi:Protein SCO1 2 [Hirschfeldia incana]|nr:Protein SCO1 2 [Hirschfeldia incana]